MSTKSAHDLIFETTARPYLDLKFDDLFKAIVSAGWCVKSDGHVESPQGYFSVTEIPSHVHELKDMQDAVEEGHTPWSTWPESGWYVTVEDNLGFIYVYPTSGEAQAIELFVKLADAYAKWDAE